MTEPSKVNLFIVGAPKCASTSLYDLFAEDPDYAVTRIKETHFFSQDDVKQSYYDDVPLIDDVDGYHDLYLGDGTRIDICPSYFASQSAIERIKAYNPEARILCLIREPIKRAISHYKMDVTLGYAKPDQFEAIWRQREGEHYAQYFGIGRYHYWIEQWQQAFGADQVYIANLVDYPFAEGKPVVEAFLTRTLDVEELPVSNVAKTYNLPFGTLRKLGLLRLWETLVPAALKEQIKALVPRKPPVSVDLSSALRSELEAFYHSEQSLLSSPRPTLQPSDHETGTG